MADSVTFTEIKRALEQDPNSLSIAMRDRLVLSGMIELFQKVDAIEMRQAPLITFYKAAVFVSTIFTGTLVMFLWGIFTGQVQVIFK